MHKFVTIFFYYSLVATFANMQNVVQHYSSLANMDGCTHVRPRAHVNAHAHIHPYSHVHIHTLTRTHTHSSRQGSLLLITWVSASNTPGWSLCKSRNFKHSRWTLLPGLLDVVRSCDHIVQTYIITVNSAAIPPDVYPSSNWGGYICAVLMAEAYNFTHAPRVVDQPGLALHGK